MAKKAKWGPHTLKLSLHCSIANVSISTLMEDRSSGGEASGTTPVEECSCPEGYRGLSCQQWLVLQTNICLAIVESWVIVTQTILGFYFEVVKL